MGLSIGNRFVFVLIYKTKFVFCC